MVVACGVVVVVLLALVVALSSERGAIAVAVLLSAHWPSSWLLVRGLVLRQPKLLLLPLRSKLQRLPAWGWMLRVLQLLRRLLLWLPLLLLRLRGRRLKPLSCQLLLQSSRVPNALARHAD